MQFKEVFELIYLILHFFFIFFKKKRRAILHAVNIIIN